jgi:hypothetical protein
MLIDENIKFNTNFTLDGYVKIMSLIFEDEDFDSESLEPVIYTGVQKGIQKYLEKNRDDDLFSYVTYFVKKEVTDFKSNN